MTKLLNCNNYSLAISVVLLAWLQESRSLGFGKLQTTSVLRTHPSTRSRAPNWMSGAGIMTIFKSLMVSSIVKCMSYWGWSGRFCNTGKNTYVMSFCMLRTECTPPHWCGEAPGWEDAPPRVHKCSCVCTSFWRERGGSPIWDHTDLRLCLWNHIFSFQKWSLHLSLVYHFKCLLKWVSFWPILTDFPWNMGHTCRLIQRSLLCLQQFFSSYVIGD